MKKIALMVGKVSHRGGLENVARSLGQAFANKGCTVTLLTTGAAVSLEGIEVISLGPTSKISLVQLVRFNHLCQKWLQQNRQDLTFGLERTTSQDLYRAGSGVHAVFLKRRKEIESYLKGLSCTLNPFHQTLLSYEKRAFEAPSLRRLFTNSTMVQEEILRHFAIDPKKIQVVHNGVVLSHYKNRFDHTKSTQELYRFLFVGNGYVRKGLPLLLKALALLKEKEWHLSIVGKEKNLSYFKQMADKLALSSKVQFYGPQSNLVPFYEQADALVIPSLYDPFANVTLEALAMGLFVISSPYNGGSEILKPHMGCTIASLLDRDAFVHALNQALLAPRDCNEMKRRRESIEEWELSKQLDKMVNYSLL